MVLRVAAEFCSLPRDGMRIAARTPMTATTVRVSMSVNPVHAAGRLSLGFGGMLTINQIIILTDGPSSDGGVPASQTPSGLLKVLCEPHEYLICQSMRGSKLRYSEGGKLTILNEWVNLCPSTQWMDDPQQESGRFLDSWRLAIRKNGTLVNVRAGEI